MTLNKNEIIILFFGGGVFLILSCLLQGYVSTAHPWSDIDSSAYLRNGFLFYKYNSFSPLHAPQPLPIYALGYPLLIGFFYKIFGPSAYLIIWLQVALALIAGMLLFFTVRCFFGSCVAMIAYVLWSVNLGFLVFSHFILSEMALIFFLVMFFERFSAFLETESVWALSFAGLALGVSVLMKAAALYFPLLLAIVLWFKCRGSWRVWLKCGGIFVFSFALPLVAFMVHNKVVFDQCRLTYIDSVNLCEFFYSQVLAYDCGTTWRIEIEKLTKQCKAEGQNFDGIKRQFFQDFFSRPHVFILLWLRNVFKIFVGLYATSLKTLVNDAIRGGKISYFNMQGNTWQKAKAYVVAGAPYQWVKIVSWLEVLWSLIRYILCVIGIFFLFRTQQYLILLFFLTYIFYFSFVIACDGTARYRFFFEFVLIILAALGIQVLLSVGKNVIVKKTV